MSVNLNYFNFLSGARAEGPKRFSTFKENRQIVDDSRNGKFSFITYASLKV